MEYLKISLNVIQIIVPFIIVGIVYLLWHKQKGKEIIAGEAKDMLFKISQVVGHSSDILVLIMDSRFNANFRKGFEERLITLKTIIEEFRHSSIFISEAKEDKELSDLTNEYWYNCMKTVDDYKRMFDKVTANYQSSDDDKIIEIHNRIVNASTTLKNRLYKIATYQD